MKAITTVILELAATINWIRTRERVADWRSEVRVRKPLKATEPNLRRAQALLDDLQLAA